MRVFIFVKLRFNFVKFVPSTYVFVLIVRRFDLSATATPCCCWYSHTSHFLSNAYLKILFMYIMNIVQFLKEYGEK